MSNAELEKKSSELALAGNAELEKKSSELALAGIKIGLSKLFDRIRKAMSSKGVTFQKLIRMYTVVESAVKQIDAIVAEK